MSKKSIETIFALGNEVDLTTPTSTRQYPLGLVYECQDSTTKTIKKYMYIYGASGLTANLPYAISYSTVSGQEVKAITPATFAAPGQYICVPQVTIASTYYGWVQIQGHCEAAMGASITAGYYLSVENGGVTFTSDETTSVSTETCAAAIDATVGAATGTIYLNGRRVVIAAS